MPSSSSFLRGLVLWLSLMLPTLPAAAQDAPSRPTPEALSSRFAEPWQGAWVGPDGHAWSGNWPGDLLTPDGRAVGPEEFAHFVGTAFLVIHPPIGPDSIDWSAAWLENCHNRLNNSGFSSGSGRPDACGGWLRYYRRAGLIYPGYAYAVPVTLRLLTHSACACRTVTTETVSEYRAVRRHHHRPRIHTKDKRIRLGR